MSDTNLLPLIASRGFATLQSADFFSFLFLFFFFLIFFFFFSFFLLNALVLCCGQVPPASNRTFIERVTQPLLNETGQVRWAMNNRANYVSLIGLTSCVSLTACQACKADAMCQLCMQTCESECENVTAAALSMLFSAVAACRPKQYP